MEEGGGNKRRVVGDAGEESEEQRSPVCDGGQAKKVSDRIASTRQLWNTTSLLLRCRDDPRMSLAQRVCCD